MGGAEPGRLTRRASAPLLRLLVRCTAAGCVAVAGLAQGFGLIGLDRELKNHPLQPAEMSRLDIRAGWMDDAPDRMVFEVRNSLAAPVSCSSVQLDLRDRGKVVKSLEPAIWIPPSQLRRSGARPLRKAEVRNFSLVCTCLRRTDKGPCEQPLRD